MYTQDITCIEVTGGMQQAVTAHGLLSNQVDAVARLDWGVMPAIVQMHHHSLLSVASLQVQNLLMWADLNILDSVVHMHSVSYQLRQLLHKQKTLFGALHNTY